MWQKAKLKIRRPSLILKSISTIFVISIVAFLIFRKDIFNRHKETYLIGIIINSIEITPNDLAVTKIIIGQKIAEINNKGGINGRNLKVIYLDDKGSVNILYNLVKKTAANKDLIAFIGCRSSYRAKAIAPLLGKLKIPFIGGFSLISVNAPYPNIYSMDVSIYDIEVILQKLLQQKFKRAAYIGKTDDIYSLALLQIMEKEEKKSAGFQVVSRTELNTDKALKPTEIQQLAQKIKNSGADFLLLSLEQGASNQLLNAFWKENINIPVFTGLSDLAQINKDLVGFKTGELYDVGLQGIPGALNARLQKIINAYLLKYREKGNIEFQVGLGCRFADAIGLISQAAISNNSEPQRSIRENINKGLTSYINGNKTYYGWFANWSFTQERMMAIDELLAWKPPTSTETVLAPYQYLRKDEILQPATVIYTNIDLIQLEQVNDEEGTFEASFYLEMSATENLDITQLDFANAARNALNHEPLIEAKLIRQKVEKSELTFYNYIYKVSGKFLFDPDLKPYPFDEQNFPITIQTGRSGVNFLIQPEAQNLRDVDFESSGWQYKNNYVGYDQDIISTDTTFSSFQKNIPLYKFTYVYVLKRARIDFTLKTLVPLMAILIISYISTYIPAREFEAMAAIQVTSLLSAIALYFSITKPQMPYATISDKIFIFSYLMITSLIGTSILIYVMYREKNNLKQLARLYQRLIFPVIVIFFTFLIRS